MVWVACTLLANINEELQSHSLVVSAVKKAVASFYETHSVNNSDENLINYIVHGEEVVPQQSTMDFLSSRTLILSPFLPKDFQRSSGVKASLELAPPTGVKRIAFIGNQPTSSSNAVLRPIGKPSDVYPVVLTGFLSYAIR
jgi:hypothetical protein